MNHGDAQRAIESRKAIIRLVLARRVRDRNGISRTWREWYIPEHGAAPELPGMRVMSSIVSADVAQYAPSRRLARHKHQGDVRRLEDAEAGDVVAVSYRGVRVVVCVGGWIWGRSAALCRPWVGGKEDHTGSPFVLEAKTECELVEPARWSV